MSLTDYKWRILYYSQKPAVESPKSYEKNVKQINLATNTKAFTVLSDTFFKLNNSISDIDSRGGVQAIILDKIKFILDAHKDNYGLLQSLQFLTKLLDSIDSINDACQALLLDIVEFIVLKLKVVPFQELSTLSCLLQLDLRDSTVVGIFNLAQNLIESDSKFRSILQQTGVYANS